jgi:transposase-like protein
MRKMSRRRSEQTWRELVTRQVDSGVSVQAFCERERLNVNTFYGWRSKLGTRSALSSGKPKVSEPAGGFIDLGSLEGSASRYEIRLDLGGGVVLQVVRG